MKVVAFIEPPQGAFIERIPRHCGLLIPSTPRASPPEDGWVDEPDAEWESQPISSEQSGELTFVEIDEFLARPSDFAFSASRPVDGLFVRQ